MKDMRIETVQLHHSLFIFEPFHAYTAIKTLLKDKTTEWNGFEIAIALRPANSAPVETAKVAESQESVSEITCEDSQKQAAPQSCESEKLAFLTGGRPILVLWCAVILEFDTIIQVQNSNCQEGKQKLLQRGRHHNRDFRGHICQRHLEQV